MNNSQDSDRRGLLTARRLHEENRLFNSTGGVSAGNRCLGFRPAFKDTSSGKVYLSCFADGRPAPIHVLDGLPKALTQVQQASTCIMKHCVIAGFVLDDIFYTREEAAKAVAIQTVH